MKIMNCPLNGPRNISEFTCFGPVHDAFDAQSISDSGWSHYLFYHENKAGIIREWWRHTPSNYFFIAERHTVTDEIVATYSPSELPRTESKS
ncbi:sarcosine oxidase subunit delta [Bradyrhizobium iriomotense]|uniref:Sarcosine oxidase subunit delta n=1 Tax=Bradyrhizobium iriomotense TaxID=441950 RepID=A0ABQ6AXK8_9BRAD|nr:sarcosine oxidase subunit delta [Bradyrhizobium iriomotense]GLR84623.1 sarcosine oxidase subunit delta [Bradyrhizobium iriomotense]